MWEALGTQGHFAPASEGVAYTAASVVPLARAPSLPFIVIFLSHYPVVSPCRSGQGRGQCDQHPSSQRPSDVSPAPAPIEPSVGLVAGWYRSGGQGAGQELPLLPRCGGSSVGPRGAEETNKVKSWQNEEGVVAGREETRVKDTET